MYEWVIVHISILYIKNASYVYVFNTFQQTVTAGWPCGLCPITNC